MTKKKLRKSGILFAIIEESQHEALRYIAYKEKRSIADVTREAVEELIKKKSAEYPIEAAKPGQAERIVVHK